MRTIFFLIARLEPNVSGLGYERTAVIFLREDDELDFFLGLDSGRGIDYALTRLKRSTSEKPTAVERRLFEFVHFQHDVATGVALADLAVRWKEPEMWTKALKWSVTERQSEELGPTRVRAAWQTFGPEVVKPMYAPSSPCNLHAEFYGFNTV